VISILTPTFICNVLTAVVVAHDKPVIDGVLGCVVFTVILNEQFLPPKLMAKLAVPAEVGVPVILIGAGKGVSVLISQGNRKVLGSTTPTLDGQCPTLIADETSLSKGHLIDLLGLVSLSGLLIEGA
jgi:hypothetical protein